MKPSSLFLTLLLLFVVKSDVFAKGYPDKIVIQGNNLERPIEITDRNVLGKFSPWYGQFIDWANGPVAKPNDRPSYELLFYISVRAKRSPQNQTESRLIYNFLYSPDPSGGPGLIYLPARTDDKYRVNQAAITRDIHDGRWHRASSVWDGALKPLLPVNRHSVTAAIVTPPQTNFWLSTMVGLSVAGLGLVLVAAEILGRKHSTGKRTL
jgi:hypothetical protein